MNLIARLINKGITVTEYENIGEEYRKKWVESFFPNGNIIDNNFLWEYINSAENNVLEGKEANTAFGKVNKQFCYIFFQESNDVILVEFAGDISARDLMYEQGDYSDVYVVDKGFNWSYLIPHEKEDFGPYFIRKSK